MVGQFRRALLLTLFAMLSLPGVGFARDVEVVTSTDLKEVIRSNKDKIVAVTFWATWCSICVEHLPELSTLYEKYKNKNVEIIGVSLDDKPKAVQQFIEKKGITFPVLMARDKEEMSYVYQVKKIPLICYYKDGELEHREEGYTDPQHIEEDLRSCLQGSEPPKKDASMPSR
jgi:peroxiredoxin